LSIDNNGKEQCYSLVEVQCFASCDCHCNEVPYLHERYAFLGLLVKFWIKLVLRLHICRPTLCLWLNHMEHECMCVTF